MVQVGSKTWKATIFPNSATSALRIMFGLFQVGHNQRRALGSNERLPDRTFTALQTAGPTSNRLQISVPCAILPDSSTTAFDVGARSRLLPPPGLSHQLLHSSASSSGRTNTNESSRCETCGQSFGTRKALNRHQRSQHQPKQYLCPYPECGLLVARKDTLTRHTNNFHGRNPTHITCLYCGRPVKKRSLQEHLMSFVCRAARAVAASSNNLQTLQDTSATGHEAFLIALRMFSLIAVNFNVFVETRSDLSANILEVERLDWPQQWHTLHARVLALLRRHIDRPRNDSSTAIALHLSSTFITVMQAGRGFAGPGRLHGKGADAIAHIAHSLMCACENLYWECDNWRRTVSQYLGRALEQAEKHFVQSNQGTNNEHTSKLHQDSAFKVVDWWNNWNRQDETWCEDGNMLTSHAVTAWAVKVNSSRNSDRCVPPRASEHLSSSLDRPCYEAGKQLSSSQYIGLVMQFCAFSKNQYTWQPWPPRES